jgi:hypothetical protein
LVKSRAHTVSSEKPPLNQPEMHSAGSKRFRKKLYAVATIIMIAVIAVALLIPQGAATIPLNVEYEIGEKMVYFITQADIFKTDTKSSNLTDIVEVIDFDGETYTLNHTIPSDTDVQSIRVSFIEKVNKTGYSAYFSVEGNVLPFDTPNSDILTGLVDRPEVKVGESWQIPISSANPNIITTGTMTITFAGIQNITVPAGTYQVFRVDTSSSNVTTTFKHQSGTNWSMNTIISMNSQTYIEYGTGRQIASTTESIIRMGTSTRNYTRAVNTTLVQHIKP